MRENAARRVCVVGSRSTAMGPRYGGVGDRMRVRVPAARQWNGGTQYKVCGKQEITSQKTQRGSAVGEDKAETV